MILGRAQHVRIAYMSSAKVQFPSPSLGTKLWEIAETGQGHLSPAQSLLLSCADSPSHHGCSQMLFSFSICQ